MAALSWMVNNYPTFTKKAHIKVWVANVAQTQAGQAQTTVCMH